jgi:hypothetical protein
VWAPILIPQALPLVAAITQPVKEPIPREIHDYDWQDPYVRQNCSQLEM